MAVVCSITWIVLLVTGSRDEMTGAVRNTLVIGVLVIAMLLLTAWFN